MAGVAPGEFEVTDVQLYRLRDPSPGVVEKQQQGVFGSAPLLFRRLFRDRLTGLFRRVGGWISHIVPVLPDGSVDPGQAVA